MQIRVIAVTLLTILTASSNTLAQSLVTWKNGSITTDDVKADLLRLPQDERTTMLKSAQAISQIMDNIHVYKELEARAKAAGQINAEIEKSAELAKTRHIGTIYLTEQARLEELRLGDLTPAARENYLANKSKYIKPEQRGASHILISTSERTEIEARKIAEQIRSRAVAGEPFPDLAKKHSDDKGSASSGGSLGAFGKGVMVKPFEDAVWSIENLEGIAPLVKTQFGIHIIRLDQKSPQALQPFEEVKNDIVAQIKKEALDNWRLRFLSEIRNDVTLKIDDELFTKFTGATRKTAPAK